MLVLADMIPGRQASCAMGDAAGEYALSSLPVGRYTVTATAQGFASGTANDGEAIAVRSVNARADIVLKAGGEPLAGTVLDALGGPVPGARVRITRFLPKSREILELDTDDDGRFRTSLALGPCVVSARADGYAPVQVGATAPSENLQLVLMPGGAIQGTVVDATTREAVAGVEVRAVLAHTNRMLAPSARSDEEGEFVVRGLSPGTYRLIGESAHARGEGRASHHLTLGEHVRDAELEVHQAVQVTGKVVMAPSNEPCEQGLVMFRPSNDHGRSNVRAREDSRLPSVVSQIDYEGRVRLRGLMPGTYQVVVQCLDHVLQEGPTVVRVERADQHDVLWRVVAGLGLIVTVVDGKGVPVPHADFFLRFPKQGNGPANMMVLSTDAQGRYETPKMLEPGTYTLLPRSGHEGDPVSVNLRPASPLAQATLRLRGSADVMVSVATDVGDATYGLSVRAQRIDAASDQPEGTREAETAISPGSLTARDQGDGRYAIGPLPAGSYVISVEDGTNPPFRSAVIQVPEGAELSERIVLPRTGRLHGKVVDAHGEPVAGLSVAIRYESGADGRAPGSSRPHKQAITAADGSFELTGLDPGARFTLRAQRSAGVTAMQRDVSPGGSVTLTLAAEPVARATAQSM